MTTRYLDSSAVPTNQSETSSPKGAFDTSARLDVGAALMRNQIIPYGSSWQSAVADHTGGQAQQPEAVSSTF